MPQQLFVSSTSKLRSNCYYWHSSYFLLLPPLYCYIFLQVTKFEYLVHCLQTVSHYVNRNYLQSLHCRPGLLNLHKRSVIWERAVRSIGNINEKPIKYKWNVNNCRHNSKFKKSSMQFYTIKYEWPSKHI